MTVEKMRELPVRKNNLLVQKARYKLTAKQFDVLTHMIAKVKPTDAAGMMYNFSISEFCQVCGIERNGKEDQTIKAVLQSLADKSIWIPIEDGKERLTRWFDEVMIDKGSGVIEVSFHKSIWAYVYDVKKQFLQYPASHSYALKSKYSKYIYDFCKSYEGLGTITVSIDDFSKFDCPNEYEAFKNLKQKVLDVAVKEINSLTDINIYYDALKVKSRKYTHLRFNIKAEKNFQENVKRTVARDAALMTRREKAKYSGENPDTL